MMGTPSNDWEGAFWRADLDEAAGLLARIIEDVRPQVLVTYDSNGFYGHPDHIQAHRVAWRAFEMSDGLVHKFYATAIPKSVLAEGMKLVREARAGEDGESAEPAGSGAATASEFETVESVDDLPFGVPDEQVTTLIDARDHLDAKIAAMRAHASQIAVDSPFFALSDGVGQRAFGREYYTLLAGSRGTAGGPHEWESDLFAGID